MCEKFIFMQVIFNCFHECIFTSPKPERILTNKTAVIYHENRTYTDAKGDFPHETRKGEFYEKK